MRHFHKSSLGNNTLVMDMTHHKQLHAFSLLLLLSYCLLLKNI